MPKPLSTLHVFAKVGGRSNKTLIFTIPHNLLVAAQNMQLLKEDDVEEALDNTEEQYNVKDYNVILLMQAIAQPWVKELEDKDDFLAMLLEHGHFSVEAEEVTYGVGHTLALAKIAFAEAYVE